MDRPCFMQRASALISHRIKKVGNYVKRENKMYLAAYNMSQGNMQPIPNNSREAINI